jgi:chromosome transmission fidelity protein 1
MLETSLEQLATYISRFRTRLSGKHLVHLKRLLIFLDALKKYAVEWKEAKVTKPGSDNQNTVEVMTIPEFMEYLGRKASGINLLEIEKYLKTSKVYFWPFNEISLMPMFL